MSAPIKLLLVDDQSSNLMALKSILEHKDLELVCASSGEEALRSLLRDDFAVVLLDVQMPRLDGFETAALIRSRPRNARIPIIFVTAVNTNETHVSRGYSLGAVDYIFKPIVPEILRAKVQAFVELFRQQAQLRASEERYRLLFTAVDQAILAIREDTRKCVDANEAALRLYGYSREELIGLKRDALDAPGARPESPDSSVAIRYQRRKDGRVFPAEVTEGIAQLDGAAIRIVVVRDVTERLQAAETRQLRERERLQREFVANVSHELRTPIAAIKGFAETLRRGALEDPKNRLRFVRTIEAHAERLGALVEDLLTLSALEAGTEQPSPEPIELSTFVREVVQGMAPLATRKKVKIEHRLEPLRVSADARQLSRVFQNLLDNGIKYNRQGGRVVVEAVVEAGHVRVSITDTGVGITPEELPHVFTRFHRSNRAKALAIHGTGLGLHIVKHIVEAHGGRVWVDSKPESGTTFHFTVPLADVSAGAAAADGPARGAPVQPLGPKS